MTIAYLIRFPTSVKELGLDTNTLQRFVHPFNRKNLYYEVRQSTTIPILNLSLSFASLT